MSPELEGLEFTALAVSPKRLFLGSSQTLFLLSNPSGEIITQVTPHTTPIHTIAYSRELDVITTGAVDDRFIAVFSAEDSLTRLGSLTCTHDVRSLKIYRDTLLAITTVGTLEIFQSFNSGFDSSKKGGLTKPPTAEIHLTTTTHTAKLEVQDVVPSGKGIMISWIEGAKTGFETLEITSFVGKVEINIQTRREQYQQQVHLIQENQANS